MQTPTFNNFAFVAMLVFILALAYAVMVLRSKLADANYTIKRLRGIAKWGAPPPHVKLVDTLPPPPEPVERDPWALQRTLMEASDQHIPEQPTLTQTSLLYAALIIEEAGETMEAMLLGLKQAWQQYSFDAVSSADERGAQTVVLNVLAHVAKDMRSASAIVRDNLPLLGKFNHVPTPDIMRELLDGTTDVAVVNSGFALSLGLDGSQAYQRVLASNLSKRNDLGVIDKTPDGKWIKGPNYVAPVLDDLIA